ncbi:transcriptional activator, TenA family [Gloeothece citriformis PCC 7424]|uniref:Aminopyrimidine aminohydrolase n=1 Tax=Gloeothece citriformis (strain PCC 7424) TaxID=65393 RepID=B7K9V7_GLOC7|nr:TenA family transcriptional regulator [Gloeothece citriformis]ACK71313.1 transcriptional activator, TenA family [Gloeothece citriformis PCC 7424]
MNTLTCHSLLTQYPQAWKEATIHPFLQQCQQGTISPQQFNTWLVQDYLFVVDFTRFVARVLAVAPVEHFDVILGGLNALKNELIWFEAKAKERHLNLQITKQVTCQEYCNYMREINQMSYPVQAMALWAIELAYNQAWQLPGQMTSPYNEFADRWGNAEFTEYVKYLEKQADEALHKSSETLTGQVESVFLQVAGLERAFWQMAFNAF